MMVYVYRDHSEGPRLGNVEILNTVLSVRRRLIQELPFSNFNISVTISTNICKGWDSMYVLEEFIQDMQLPSSSWLIHLNLIGSISSPIANDAFRLETDKGSKHKHHNHSIFSSISTSRISIRLSDILTGTISTWHTTPSKARITTRPGVCRTNLHTIWSEGEMTPTRSIW